MKKTYSVTLLLLLLPLVVFAGYYDNVMNLSGDQLRNALRTLISTNTNSSYDNAKLFMFQTADNVNGTVRCIYTGHVYNISGSYNGSSDPNTEHTYAQSWFSSSQSSIKKADVHHLFPTRMQANSARGNLPLANVASYSSSEVFYANEPWQSYRGNDGYGHTVWEPAPQSKGNVARALMYFTVRYNDGLIQGGVNMLATLMQWHAQDPVDASELARNQAVYQYQNNRNPFVDHPEFVNRIWGPVDNTDELMVGIAPLSIARVYPNPFRENLTVEVESDKAGSMTTSIFNLKGQLVYSSSVALPAGKNEVVVDDLDANRAALPAGVYLIRMEKDGYTATVRTLRLQ